MNNSPSPHYSIILEFNIVINTWYQNAGAVAAFHIPTALAGFVSGLGLLVYSVIQLHVQAIKLLYFIPTFIAGTAAFIMFILMVTVVSYILFKSGDFIDDMKNMLGGLGQYPLSVYGILGQLIFTRENAKTYMS